jgi:teichuronic acid biosynthesis protein TuaF
MKETLERIWKRFRKLAILLILLPFLTAGAAYLFQKEGPTSYTANAEIQLAKLGKDTSDLEYTNYTDAEFAKAHITSDQFLDQIEEKNPNIKASEIKSKINFVIKPAKLLGISYTGDNPEETEETLNLIVDQYINESNETKNQIAQKYEDAKTEPGSDKKTASEYDIIIKGLSAAKDLKEVQLEQVEESTKNSVAFGFLIGLILSFMILLLPEVFIKE